MPRPVVFIVLLVLGAGCVSAGGPPAPTATTTPSVNAPKGCFQTGFELRDINATIVTSKGSIGVVLYGAKSPITVCNFLRYVEEDFYDGTVFHRICSHVIQAGGYDPYTRQQKTGHEPIKNEANESELRNYKGTLGMARNPDPDSATSHFFINNLDNNYLDFDGREDVRPGYAVFGNITEGWTVEQDIADTQVVPEPDDYTSDVTGEPDVCSGAPAPDDQTTITDIVIAP